jgi:hypothetical protein
MKVFKLVEFDGFTKTFIAEEKELGEPFPERILRVKLNGALEKLYSVGDYIDPCGEIEIIEDLTELMSATN